MRKRVFSVLLVLTLVVSLLSVTAFAEEVKYKETKMAEGWIKVENEGGATLGYYPDSGVTLLVVDGYAFKDLNKNGVLDVYEDWRLDTNTRAADAASLLSIEEIAGLMLLTRNGGYGGNFDETIQNSLNIGNRTFNNTASDLDTVVTFINQVQAYCEKLSIGIPAEFHGETGNGMSNTQGTYLPSPLGLGATFEPELAEKIGNIIGVEYRAVGFTTLNSPQIDLTTEPRWSRISGSFTEDPALGSDIAAAYVNGMQSTFDAEGNDLGWGTGSINATLKHFPGNGAAEAGREAHNFYGKCTVYPGDNFYTQLLPFKAAMELKGKTGSVAAVMPDYSISIDENGKALGNEKTASGFNSYKITDILRDEMEFDGMVITDYDIVDQRGWGVEDASEAERVYLIVEAGVDKMGNYSNVDTVLEGFRMYAEKHSQEEMEVRVRDSARRIIRNTMQLGMLENPYLSAKESAKVLATKENAKIAEEAYLKSVVMLKNHDNLIQAATGEKKTVYIPMIYTAATAGGSSSAASPANWNTPVDLVVASKYFNVVTDKVSTTLTGPADENGAPTVSENDVVRASADEIAACAFTLVLIDNPSSSGGYDSATESYIPISLQYGEYTANSPYVRQVSLGGDTITVTKQDVYGEQTVKTSQNLSYYGKSTVAKNADELDKVAYAASVSDNVVVVISASNPMIFSEFESTVDSILMDFGGISDKLLMEILAGNFEPYGLLPLQMPANMETVEAQYEDVPRDMDCHVDADGNTYDFAFGLNWSGVINDARVAKYNVEPLCD